MLALCLIFVASTHQSPVAIASQVVAPVLQWESGPAGEFGGPPGFLHLNATPFDWN